MPVIQEFGTPDKGAQNLKLIVLITFCGERAYLPNAQFQIENFTKKYTKLVLKKVAVESKPRTALVCTSTYTESRLCKASETEAIISTSCKEAIEAEWIRLF